MRKLVLLLLCLLLQACLKSEEVKPWDRNVLAQDRAQLISDRLESAADEHIYFSKEAANGGQSLGGGGCGCN
ncbi:MAG: DUF4266 domain-containing protein [Gammaproteobacteria bacterium]|nr:DUF4266 domain-containing protein [Gammaproteobacteria bacterium]MDH5692301.1 DUF4266 domain-containing protein [Gammaproteobacteria bacterium]